MKKKVKKSNAKKDIISEIKDEFKRHTGVLTEQMRKEVKTVAEGHSMIISRFDNVENGLSEIASKCFKNEMNIESIKSKVGTIDIKVDRLDIKVDRIEKELGTVKNAVLDINKTTKNHETRITKLEEKVHT